MVGGVWFPGGAKIIEENKMTDKTQQALDAKEATQILTPLEVWERLMGYIQPMIDKPSDYTSNQELDLVVGMAIPSDFETIKAALESQPEVVTVEELAEEMEDAFQASRRLLNVGLGRHKYVASILAIKHPNPIIIKEASDDR